MNAIQRLLLRHKAPFFALVVAVTVLAALGVAAHVNSAGGGSKTATLLDESSDADDDGCSNAEELGPDQRAGGLRDPESFWDFFDVPTGALFQRDGDVSGLDLFAVLGRFNASGDTGIDPFSDPPPQPAYHTAFDRTSGGPGADPWDSGPPDGNISGLDFFGVLAQFSQSCHGPLPPVELWEEHSSWTWTELEEYVQDIAQAAQAQGVGEVLLQGGTLVAGQTLPGGAEVVCVDPVTGVYVVQLAWLPTPPAPFETEIEYAPEAPTPTATPPQDDGDGVPPEQEDQEEEDDGSLC